MSIMRNILNESMDSDLKDSSNDANDLNAQSGQGMQKNEANNIWTMYQNQYSQRPNVHPLAERLGFAMRPEIGDVVMSLDDANMKGKVVELHDETFTADIVVETGPNAGMRITVPFSYITKAPGDPMTMESMNENKVFMVPMVPMTLGVPKNRRDEEGEYSKSNNRSSTTNHEDGYDISSNTPEPEEMGEEIDEILEDIQIFEDEHYEAQTCSRCFGTGMDGNDQALGEDESEVDEEGERPGFMQRHRKGIMAGAAGLGAAAGVMSHPMGRRAVMNTGRMMGSKGGRSALGGAAKKMAGQGLSHLGGGVHQAGMKLRSAGQGALKKWRGEAVEQHEAEFLTYISGRLDNLSLTEEEEKHGRLKKIGKYAGMAAVGAAAGYGVHKMAKRGGFRKMGRKLDKGVKSATSTGRKAIGKIRSALGKKSSIGGVMKKHHGAVDMMRSGRKGVKAASSLKGVAKRQAGRVAKRSLRRGRRLIKNS